ncbi:MAG: cation-transporting P-type ATPase, partial [Caldilineaceae bacterium]
MSSPTIDSPARAASGQLVAAGASPRLEGAAPMHTRSVEDALNALQSSTNGLDETTAQARLQEYGPNELVETGATPWWRLLWEQLTAVM